MPWLIIHGRYTVEEELHGWGRAYSCTHILTDSHSILVRWRNYFSQLLNVRGVNDARQTEIHTTEPLLPYAFRHNRHTSRFAHLIEHAHSFGTINNIRQVLHYQKKGTHLNTVERFYNHAEYASNNHLNDSHIVFPNAIFDTLLKTHRY